VSRPDRVDTFGRVLSRMNSRIANTELAVADLRPQVFAGLSVSDVSVTSGAKTILSTTVTVLEDTLLECYVRARGTIGSGKVLRLKVYIDDENASQATSQLLAWTGSISNEIRRTAPGTDTGLPEIYPNAKGGFVLLDGFSGNELTAGEHTIRFDVYTTDGGASTTGSVSATIALRAV